MQASLLIDFACIVILIGLRELAIQDSPYLLICKFARYFLSQDPEHPFTHHLIQGFFGIDYGLSLSPDHIFLLIRVRQDGAWKFQIFRRYHCCWIVT